MNSVNPMNGEGLLTAKLDRLINILKSMESAVIAYSGGVDSTFLLKAAVFSRIKVLAVTGLSPTISEQDFQDAGKLAEVLGVPHRVIETAELDNDEFVKNPPDRCYHCKTELFGRLRFVAESGGYRFVLDGSNLDDLDDWRPGRRAAAELAVRSPLIEARMRKKDVRELSRTFGLPTWDKPSSPCLSSRFPYGEPITLDALKRVESAEGFLKSLGFREFRVRHHGDTARIEIMEEDMPWMLDPGIRNSVAKKLKALGYRFITIDLEGFRSGRMNEGKLKEGGG